MLDRNIINDIANKCEEFSLTGYLSDNDCTLTFCGFIDGELFGVDYDVEEGWFSDPFHMDERYLTNYYPLPLPSISDEHISNILLHLPMECKTNELMEQLGVDVSYRGVHYLDRCFMKDKQGEFERIMSDHFKSIILDDKLPSLLMAYSGDENFCKGMASIWQWTCTNVGFVYLKESFNKAGWKLSMEKIDNE